MSAPERCRECGGETDLIRFVELSCPDYFLCRYCDELLRQIEEAKQKLDDAAEDARKWARSLTNFEANLEVRREWKARGGPPP